MISSPEMVTSRSSKSLCYYRNQSTQLQVAHISEGNALLAERVVFPGEKWLFEASPKAQIHIHRQDLAGNIQIEKISCDRYQVKTNNGLD